MRLSVVLKIMVVGESVGKVENNLWDLHNYSDQGKLNPVIVLLIVQNNS